MSFFGKTLGERPVAQQQIAPMLSELLEEKNVQPVHAIAFVGPSIGSRPVGECPSSVDWGGVVLSVATEVVLPEPIAAIQAFSSEEVLAAIDAALRQNSARVAVNGLFDIDEIELIADSR